MTLSNDANEDEKSEARILKKIIVESTERVEKLSKQLAELKKKVVSFFWTFLLF